MAHLYKDSSNHTHLCAKGRCYTSRDKGRSGFLFPFVMHLINGTTSACQGCHTNMQEARLKLLVYMTPLLQASQMRTM